MTHVVPLVTRARIIRIAAVPPRIAPRPSRVGVPSVAGEIVSVEGDVYGPTVNLASGAERVVDLVSEHRSTIVTWAPVRPIRSLLFGPTCCAR